MQSSHLRFRHDLQRWLVLAIFAAAWPAAAARAQSKPTPPRLVVFVVIDQLRADYLTRFQNYFGPGGFRRLMDNGAHFANAHFSYGGTTTAPGHATIATGRNPRQHGIVANDWYQGRPVPALKAAVYDPNVHMLVSAGGKTEGRSPRNLIGPTLADQMRLANRHSRVFTVSLKDRAAILLGGQQPDGAFWFDVNVGEIVTSDWYMKELPAYVREFNTHRWVDRFLNTKWDRLLPLAAYEFTQPLDPQWIGNAGGLGPEFPHILPHPPGPPDKTFYTAVFDSPFGHDVVLEMVRRILTFEKLGTGDAADFLGISFSSFDAAGHLYGPESAEMMDFILRTDRQMAALLELLDHAVGLNRCLMVLTGDHGATTLPRTAEQLRLGGGRIDMAAVTKQLNASLSGITPLPNDTDYVRTVDLPWIHLDPAFGRLDLEARRRVILAARDTLQAVDGIAAVHSTDELAAAMPSPADPHRWRAWQSYYPRRSAELFVELAPYWTPKGTEAADHGDGSDQSRHVPIVFMGSGIRAGRYFSPADPMDIAVTTAALLGIEPPLDASGRVLEEAIHTELFTR